MSHQYAGLVHLRHPCTVIVSCDGVAHRVPVFEEFSIPHTVENFMVTRRALIKQMQELLFESRINITHASEMEIVKDIEVRIMVSCWVGNLY